MLDCRALHVYRFFVLQLAAAAVFQPWPCFSRVGLGGLCVARLCSARQFAAAAQQQQQHMIVVPSFMLHCCCVHGMSLLHDAQTPCMGLHDAQPPCMGWMACALCVCTLRVSPSMSVHTLLTERHTLYFNKCCDAWLHLSAFKCLTQ